MFIYGPFIVLCSLARNGHWEAICKGCLDPADRSWWLYFFSAWFLWIFSNTLVCKENFAINLCFCQEGAKYGELQYPSATWHHTPQMIRHTWIMLWDNEHLNISPVLGSSLLSSFCRCCCSVCLNSCLGDFYLPLCYCLLTLVFFGTLVNKSLVLHLHLLPLVIFLWFPLNFFLTFLGILLMS